MLAEAATVLSDGIKDAKGALASLNISGNNISSDQEAKVRKICADKSIECAL